MKRWLAVLLTVMMLLGGAVNVPAETVSACGDGLSVYIGPEDKLYVPGNAYPLNEMAVRGIYAVDSTFVLYATSQELAEDTDRECALYLMDLSAEEPSSEEIDPDVLSAVWSRSEGLLYYVCNAEPKALFSYDPVLHAATRLIQAEEEITALRASADGVLATVGAEELLYIPVVRMLTAPLFAAEKGPLFVGDGFDAFVDAEGILKVRRAGQEEAREIAQNVLTALVQDDCVYYLQDTENGAALVAYTVSLDNSAQMDLLSETPQPQLAANGGWIYYLSKTGGVYAYQVVSGRSEKIGEVPSEVTLPVLCAGDAMALVYDDAAEMGYRFVETIPAGTFDQEEAEAPEATPVPAPTAAPEYETLQKGMRGDAVTALQKALMAHGYLGGSADGVFGASTQNALMYLQGDMGLEETGTANAALQKKLLKGDVPDYEAYVPLSGGDEGQRVRDLQQRLRTLCYMTVNAGGHYKDGTTAAVKRFQKQMGYKATGKITAKELKALFKKGCPECTEYYKLDKGDSSPAVKRLNKRLKALGYFSGSAGESYGKATVSAVQKFQSYNGLQTVAGCDGNLQSMIFSKNAKKYQPVKPDPTPTPTWTKPTSKQLKVMRNWLNKHFGTKWDNKQAINRLQEQLSDVGVLEYGYQTGVYDKATWGAVWDFQMQNGYEAICTGIADKATLKELFN